MRDSKNLASLLSADRGPSRIWTILILFSPLVGSVFGFVLDERLKTYWTNYHQHFKDLYEDELRDTLDHLILNFVNAIDSKSSWTKGHSFRVQYYSTMIAKELELSESQTELLSISALLHDIGKIGTYDDILNKTEQLTSEEFAMIKKHPDNAVKVLEPITRQDLVANASLQSLKGLLRLALISSSAV
jgi:HD-GYP domain-containing protein (c-di-GMP phosphodiesterase class II)